MARQMLSSGAISVFCESVSMMLSAGIQTEEAVYVLGEDMRDAAFKDVCMDVYRGLISGKNLTEAMEESEAFPRHVVEMTRVGERSGRLEGCLRSLSAYYGVEDRLFTKVRSAITYPAALLCIMSAILAFTVALIIPVFARVYESMTGSLAASSFSPVTVSIIIGWVALIATIICAIVALVGAGMARSENGRQRLIKTFEKLPATRTAMRQLALSRFSSALSTYIASGINVDDAMKDAVSLVDHQELRPALQQALDLMLDSEKPRGLTQALTEVGVYESVLSRMLSIGSRSGSLETTLSDLSEVLFEDSVDQIDRTINSVEPTFEALLTIAVGATLIAVMLPLIGIMGSIG